MSFVGLACCLTLLAYGVAVLAGNVLVHPFLHAARRMPDPARRARRILGLRISPSVLALGFALGVVLPAFADYEPDGTGERVGLALLVAAIVSFGLLLAGLLRGALGLLATRRIARAWTRSGRPIRLDGVAIPAFEIDDPFPIVALAGCARPVLFVSRRVLARCTSGELAAIVDHELGHIRRRDPWSRVVLRACPDLLACTPLGTSLERAWEEAAELAADDRAAAGDAARSLDLASALLAVARLAGDASPRRLPVLALYHGGSVAERVARLLEPREVPQERRSRRARILAGVAVTANLLLLAAAASPEVLEQVHRVLESVVLHLR